MLKSHCRLCFSSALWRIVGSAILLASVFLAVHRAPASSAPRQEALRQFLQNYARKAECGNGTATRYFSAFIDLNGDNVEDVIVHLVGRCWCGSGGCQTLVLTPDRGSYKLITIIFITRPPIRVFKGTSHGWRNLGVWVYGGGIRPGYEAELRFDGTSYPSNPSGSPATKADQKATGAIVIDSSRDGTALDP